MRPCAALLLLVSASLPGCGLTKTVWRTAAAPECPVRAHDVLVSPKGAVRLSYSAQRCETWGIGFIGPLKRGGAVTVDRVIRVRPSEMERLLAREGRSATVEVSGKELQKLAGPEPFELFGLLGSSGGASVKFSREVNSSGEGAMTSPNSEARTWVQQVREAAGPPNALCQICANFLSQGGPFMSLRVPPCHESGPLNLRR